jgi:hypothetical protein
MEWHIERTINDISQALRTGPCRLEALPGKGGGFALRLLDGPRGSGREPAEMRRWEFDSMPLHPGFLFFKGGRWSEAAYAGHTVLSVLLGSGCVTAKAVVERLPFRTLLSREDDNPWPDLELAAGTAEAVAKLFAPRLEREWRERGRKATHEILSTFSDDVMLVLWGRPFNTRARAGKALLPWLAADLDRLETVMADLEKRSAEEKAEGGFGFTPYIQNGMALWLPLVELVEEQAESGADPALSAFVGVFLSRVLRSDRHPALLKTLLLNGSAEQHGLHHPKSVLGGALGAAGFPADVRGAYDLWRGLGDPKALPPEDGPIL